MTSSPQSRNHYGHKNHIQEESDNKITQKYKVTDTSVHDSQVFEELLDEGNTSKAVWADSAYRSEEKGAYLKENGYRSGIQRRAYKNRSLTEWEKQGNRTRSKTRSRVEYIFGAQSNLRRKAIYCIGIMRARTEIGLMNLVYNETFMLFREEYSVLNLEIDAKRRVKAKYIAQYSKY